MGPQNVDWSALATILVGIPAIVGAYVVGARQGNIASRQADILARQVRLEETKLKADLFEKRLATYEATTSFLYHIGDLGDTVEGDARIANFATKFRESHFLFGSEVHAALMEIWDKANKIRVSRAISISNYEEGVRGDPQAALKLTQDLAWALQRAAVIHEIFQPYLDVDARDLGATAP